MANENALFEDDFEDVFSDDPLADLVRPGTVEDEAEAVEPAVEGEPADEGEGAVATRDTSTAEFLVRDTTCSPLRCSTRNMACDCRNDLSPPNS